MQIGELSKRVTIQAPSEASDGMSAGGTVTWSDLFSTWAKVHGLAGREYLQSGQMGGTISHRITIRYRPGVTIRHRVAYDSRVFNIRSVINLNESNTWLEIACEEEV